MREAENPIRDIAERFGGGTAMARQVGVGQPTVWDWINKRRLPYQQIMAVIDAGRLVNPPIDLEPNDFFPARYRKIRRRRSQTP